MKKAALRSAITFAVLFPLILFALGTFDSLIECVISSFFCGALFYFGMLSFLRNITGTFEKRVSEDKTLQEGLLTYAGANYVPTFLLAAIGGLCCLYSDRLLFVPHKFNLSHKERVVLLKDVASISPYKVCGLFKVGFKIALNSGKAERFVMDKDSQLSKDLFRMFPTSGVALNS